MREVEAATDYLAIYLVQFGDKPRSPAEVKQHCLAEYKQLLVDRANKMQQKFDMVKWSQVLGITLDNNVTQLFINMLISCRGTP